MVLKKFTDLTADTTPASADLMATAKSPFGAGSSRKVTLANLPKGFGWTTNMLTWLGTPSSANLRAALTDENGTGAALFDGCTSATFITPVLGTPSSGTLTSCTGLPISTGVAGLGSGVATALGVNVGSAGAFLVNGGALGTPSSGTLTNCTGLPLGGITGLGSGVATFLATPTSANLAAALTDETGTGANVFADSPAFTTKINLPNNTAPSTTAAADTAFDTNAWGSGRGAIQVYDGTANTYVVAALASDVPTNGQVPTWNTGGTITWETPGGGGITGTLTSSRVPYASGASTVVDDSRFTFSATGSGQLGVPPGTSALPGIALGATNQGFSDWASGGIGFSTGGALKVTFGDGCYTHNSAGFYFSSGSTPSNTPDSGIARYAANQTVAIRSNLNAVGEFVARAFLHEPRTFANLPTGAEGMIARITDCTATTVGNTAAGGGANHVYVAHNGTNWIIMTAF